MKKFIKTQILIKLLKRIEAHLVVCDQNGGMHDWGQEQNLLKAVKSYRELMEQNIKEWGETA